MELKSLLVDVNNMQCESLKYSNPSAKPYLKPYQQRIKQ